MIRAWGASPSVIGREPVFTADVVEATDSGGDGSLEAARTGSSSRSKSVARASSAAKKSSGCAKGGDESLYK